jgi:hypothetical protein
MEMVQMVCEHGAIILRKIGLTKFKQMQWCMSCGAIRTGSEYTGKWTDWLLPWREEP